MMTTTRAKSAWLTAAPDRRRRQIPISEEAIHKAVIDALHFLHAPGVVFYHVPNGGWRHPTTAGRFVRMGVRSGVPDITIHLPGGRTAFLELKAATGRLSPEQQRFMDQVAAIGCLTAVAYAIDEALEILRRWGAVRSPVNREVDVTHQ
jgi:hypothetical protein